MMMITVNYKDEKYILNVKKDDLVIDVKKQLFEQSGVYYHNQNLFLNKTELENDKKLKDYSISNGTTLNLIHNELPCTLVFFKPPFGKKIEIEVDQSSTFKDVKDEIFKLRGIPPNQQQIIIDQKPLRDESKVLDNMSGYNTAELIIPQEITKKIFVKSPYSDPIQFSVEEKTTIEDIKCEIAILTYQYYGRRELMFTGIQLENDKTVKDYMIPENATLDMLIYQRKGMIIFIKDFSRKFTPIEVKLQDTVFDVKKQIEDLFGIPISQQTLLFEGRMLLDQNQLQLCRLFPFATIELKSQIQVSFKLSSTDKTFTVNVDPMDEVKTLKYLIESITGLKMSDQILIFQCKQLEDSFPLKYYSITNNSSILVVPFQRKQIKITVANKGDESLTLDARITDFIKEFKLKINNKTGIPVEKQVLAFNHQILHDDNSFHFYNIIEDVTINLLLIERGGFFVFYKISPTNYAPIEVKKDDTSSYIKKEMQKRGGIPIKKEFDASSFEEGQILEYIDYFYEEGAVEFFLQAPGKTHTIHIRLDRLIIDLKKIVYYLEEISIKQQFIHYQTHTFEDDKTIESCGIHEGSLVYAIIRLVGD